MGPSWRRFFRGPWWHVPLACGACIAVFFVTWELLEVRLLGGASPETRRWLYVARGVFGASLIAVLTAILVRRQERRMARVQRAVVQSEKLAAIGQMAAGVAHEIGNPLASISSVVQLVQRGSLPTAEAERLNLVHGEIERINRIVHQLVDFARPGASEASVLDVADVLDESIELARYDPRGRTVRFERRYHAGLPPVRAVREHLMQVFINVMHNALDATAPSGSVVVSATPLENAIEITFADNGVGIPTDQIDHVFQPFFTTKPRGRGTGLGLAISRHLVSQHGGAISLQSRIGEGTRVTVRLPIHRTAAARTAAREAAPHA